MILYIAAPAVLMALSFLVTASGRIPVLAVLFAITGGIMSGMSDVSLSMNSQAFSGVLINAIGVVLALTGACLQLFATETGGRLRWMIRLMKNPLDRGVTTAYI